MTPPLLLLLPIEEVKFTFVVDIPSYCMANKNAGLYNVPEYFDLGMGITQRDYLIKVAMKEFEYVNF